MPVDVIREKVTTLVRDRDVERLLALIEALVTKPAVTRAALKAELHADRVRRRDQLELARVRNESELEELS